MTERGVAEPRDLVQLARDVEGAVDPGGLPPSLDETLAKAGNTAALRDWVGRVGFHEALAKLKDKIDPKTGQPFGLARAKRIIGKLKGMAHRAGTLAPEHSYDPTVRAMAKGVIAAAVEAAWARLFAKGARPGRCPHCKSPLAKRGVDVGYCDACDRRVPMAKSTGGEGSRGGTVIGHTRSGKPIYDSHDHPEHAGFSRADHMDAATEHERVAGRAIDRAARLRHREQSFAHQEAADQMDRNADAEHRKAKAEARLRERRENYAREKNEQLQRDVKASRKAALDAQPEPTHLPQEHGRYFHHPPGTRHVPLEELHPTKSVGQEHAESGGRSISRAAKAMHNASRGQGEKRAPLTVRRREDGHYDVVDGNATYHAAKQHGWTSLPVRET